MEGHHLDEEAMRILEYITLTLIIVLTTIVYTYILVLVLGIGIGIVLGWRSWRCEIDRKISII